MQAEWGRSSQLGSASKFMDPMRRLDSLITKWTSELMDADFHHGMPPSRGAANRAPFTAASPAGELGCPYGGPFWGPVGCRYKPQCHHSGHSTTPRLGVGAASNNNKVALPICPTLVCMLLPVGMHVACMLPVCCLICAPLPSDTLGGPWDVHTHIMENTT